MKVHFNQTSKHTHTNTQADGQQLQSFGIRSPQDLMVLDLADITEMTQNMSFSTKKALKVFVQLSPEVCHLFLSLSLSLSDSRTITRARTHTHTRTHAHAQ